MDKETIEKIFDLGADAMEQFNGRILKFNKLKDGVVELFTNKPICNYCKDIGIKYCGVPLGHIKCPEWGKY